MASLGLASDELKQLDLMRNRFLQLASSLSSLRQNVLTTQPLPSRESLQASAAILLQNVNSIQEITSENAELFRRIALHPSTNFPGRTQEHILLHLLRKKLEPDVEGLVEEARKTATEAGIDASKLGGLKLGGSGGGGGGGGGYGGGEDEDEEYGLDQEGEVPPDPFNEQWADIRDACDDGIKHYIETQAREPYTVAEQEMGTKNVRTGLRRSLEEDESDEDEDDEDEDDEDEDEEMGGTGKSVGGAPIPGQGAPGAAAAGGQAKASGLQPEHILWFAARGDLNLPPNVDLESQRKAKNASKRPGQTR